MPRRQRYEFTETAKRELRAWSNCNCMICRKDCAGERQGEAAHIIPASGNGPRSEYRTGDKATSRFISSSENGLWLCPNCHTDIDTSSPTKTYEELVAINKRYRELYRLKSDLYRDLHISDGYFEKLADAIKRQESLSNLEVVPNSKIERIELAQKNKINELNNYQIRQIEKSYEYDFPAIYASICSGKLDAEASYLASALKGLYRKLSETYPTSEEILDRILESLKQAVSEYGLNEWDIVSYYYVLCEIFRKEL